MARKQSIVLTPAEKKEAVAAARLAVREAKAALKELATGFRETVKLRKGEDKAYQTALKDMERENKALLCGLPFRRHPMFESF